MTRGDLVASTQAQVDAAFGIADLISYGLRLDVADVTVMDDGMPYALIPTETVLNVKDHGGKVSVKTTTVALRDHGVWYLVRIDDQRQIALLRAAYPAFSDWSFPPAALSQWRNEQRVR